VYIAGYLVWSINAWQNNLGIPPALDLQYFVAGSVPVLIVGLAYLVGQFLWNFISKVWPQKVDADATGGWRIIRRGLFVLLGASFITLVFVASPSFVVIMGLVVLLTWVSFRRLKDYDELTARGKKWRTFLSIAWGTLFVALLVFLFIKGDDIDATLFGFLDDITDRAMPYVSLAFGLAVLFLPPVQDRMWQLMKVGYFALFLLFLPLLGLLYYAVEIYPSWPQELGGVQPRCAYVDVSPETLSAQTRAMLLPAQSGDTTLSVMRSHQLSVLYSNDTYLLVKSPTQEQRREPIVYELKRDDLKSITWCD